MPVDGVLQPPGQTSGWEEGNGQYKAAAEKGKKLEQSEEELTAKAAAASSVYQLTCKACGEYYIEYYIGSTTRFLHDRTKEHLTNDNSSVKKHLTTHHHNNSHNIEVKVITRENDPVNLRLHEAYYIRKYKLGLNSREECTELKGEGHSKKRIFFVITNRKFISS